MQAALERAGLTAPAFTGSVEVEIEAVFELPRSAWRKTAPVPRQRGRGSKDWDNIGKAVCVTPGTACSGSTIT
jgi:hypothetical protein